MDERVNGGVVVDAGHGGSDPGAISGNLKEKDFTLEAALYMYDRFKQLGVPVVITRDFDEDLSRADRLKRANEAFGGDPNTILISNHINAGGGEGAEVVYALRNNSTLAKDVLTSIGEAGQIMRKYYQRRLPENPNKDYYYIIRETSPMQSLLVEYGFIDNAKDQVKLQNDLLSYVEAVVKAVTEYLGFKYTPPFDSTTYTVKKGDSLYSIARQFGITVNELKSSNNLTGDTLTVGQKLTIPQSDVSGDLYQVQKGDTLYSISRKLGVTVADLRRANSLNADTLTPGQLLVIPSTEDNNDSTTTNTYIVARGDSLWTIANKNNITVDELKKANNLTSNTLSVGQVLVIPTSSSEIPTPPDNNGGYETTYVVKRGDSLWSIANNYGITVDELKNANGITNNMLTIGQELIIPVSVPSDSTNTTTYVVKRGDSLWLIANKYNTTVDNLKLLNNLSTNLLTIGQELIVPAN